MVQSLTKNKRLLLTRKIIYIWRHGLYCARLKLSGSATCHNNTHNRWRLLSKPLFNIIWNRILHIIFDFPQFISIVWYIVKPNSSISPHVFNNVQFSCWASALCQPFSLLVIRFQRPCGLESCIQRRMTTCLPLIRKSLASARASTLTTNMCECQLAMGSSGLNAHWS